MKTIFLFTLMLLYTACHADSSSAPQTTEKTTAPASATGEVTGERTFTEEFMELLNNHRNSLGLPTLILSDDLSSIVQIHCQNMAEGLVEFGHIGFSLRCSDARLALNGGNFCAENVAMGQRTPQAAFDAWMNSEGHRLNMESPRITHTGFAYARSSTGVFYWTQIFLER